MGNKLMQFHPNNSTISANKTVTSHSTISGNNIYYINDTNRAKTLPARCTQQDVKMHSVNSHSTAGWRKSNKKYDNTATPPSQPSGETSRVLFLLYLIHRTWHVVVDTMDTRSKGRLRKTKKSTKAESDKSIQYEDSLQRPSGCTITLHDYDNKNDMDASSYCSQYSCCSCSYCVDETQNVYNSIGELGSVDSFSICESDFSAYYQQRRQMAPSVCQNSPKLQPHHATSTNGANAGIGIIIGNIASTCSAASSIAQKSNCGSSSLNGSMVSYKMTSSEQSWPQAVFNKENQRPPVYNPEDYVQSLKKFGKRQNSKAGTQNVRCIYDASSEGNTTKEEYLKAATLPTKHSEYKSPIPAPPASDSEMSLRQFASITDLLTKLRADLRVSFPSFVQEFVTTPSDGISLLLEVLRAIQLAQSNSAMLPAAAQSNGTASMPRNVPNYQRRALLDELACLQCLSICCSRSLDATARLGNTPVGLMPLASSATGQGIRARILALQLLTSACDKQTFGPGSQKIVAAGHTAVSESMSTLRLRCSEPVRFRLLVGMLNSGGGSGELQCAGVRFINTFLESAVNLQQRLYLQAELFQAGFEPSTLVRTISSSSPWLDALRNEIKRFNELHVDVDKMIIQARDADRVRSQMVILERRVQILHEEKAVLTSMERRLQERCAELQREIFRLQGAQHENTFKMTDKQTPVALPRQVPAVVNQSKSNSLNKRHCSEHEDEGISSSETGPSLSPVPILVLPQKTSNALKVQTKHKKKSNATNTVEDEDAATIEDVIGQLDNVVNEAEKQISNSSCIAINGNEAQVKNIEKDIVPINIVPQPPRKSRSLAHLMPAITLTPTAENSDLDGSDYGIILLQNQIGQEAVERINTLHTFFDEIDYDMPDLDKAYSVESPDIPEANANTTACNASTNRELLDVIMNARHTEDDPTIKALRNSVLVPLSSKHSVNNEGNDTPKPPTPPAQQFNGVFFMTGMNTPQKYPKADLTAALQARRASKNIERLEAAFILQQPSGNEVNMIREKSRSNQQIYFGSNPTLRLTTSNVMTNTYANHITVNTNCNNISTRTRSYTQGSKVTDLPSGLY